MKGISTTRPATLTTSSSPSVVAIGAVSLNNAKGVGTGSTLGSAGPSSSTFVRSHLADAGEAVVKSEEVWWSKCEVVYDDDMRTTVTSREESDW